MSSKPFCSAISSIFSGVGNVHRYRNGKIFWFGEYKRQAFLYPSCILSLSSIHWFFTDLLQHDFFKFTRWISLGSIDHQFFIDFMNTFRYLTRTRQLKRATYINEQHIRKFTISMWNSSRQSFVGQTEHWWDRLRNPQGRWHLHRASVNGPRKADPRGLVRFSISQN